jgi:hypothetical protein
LQNILSPKTAWRVSIAPAIKMEIYFRNNAWQAIKN